MTLVRTMAFVLTVASVWACGDDTATTTTTGATQAVGSSSTATAAGGNGSGGTASGGAASGGGGAATSSGGSGGTCMGGGPAMCPMQGCACVSTGLVPLTDMGSLTYMGEDGGLYGGGSNVRPSAHDAAGLALAQAVVARNAMGNPDPNGRYVFISVGMSNTTQEFSQFVPLANTDASKDPALTVVDGAQGGQTASVWANPTANAWTVLDQRLAQAMVTPAQVAVAWVKLANAGPMGAFPTYAQALQANMATVAQNLTDRYPNLKLAYFSSRIYAGYATTALNPEPYSYESGFSVRWLLLDQIGGSAQLNYDPNMGAVQAPWLAWGPYLWADGLNPRCDGMTYLCTDLQMDGTHPSNTGQQKVAQMLLDFVTTDTTARQWYLANP